MSAQTVLHSQIFTTPDELRQIADAMEERCRTIAWGENATVFSWHGPYCLVDVVIDQELVPWRTPERSRPDADGPGPEEASTDG